jgi:hypothetical protein
MVRARSAVVLAITECAIPTSGGCVDPRFLRARLGARYASAVDIDIARHGFSGTRTNRARDHASRREIAYRAGDENSEEAGPKPIHCRRA